MYHLTVLEAGCPKSRWWQKHSHQGLWERVLPCLFQLLLPPHIPWLLTVGTSSLTSIQSQPPLSRGGLSLSACLCLYFSSCKILHCIEFRAHLVPLWLHLNLIKCIFNGPVSKLDQSYSGELGVRTLMYLVGDTVHPEQQVARKVLLCVECYSESWRTGRQHWGRRACTWWTLCELKEQKRRFCLGRSTLMCFVVLQLLSHVRLFAPPQTIQSLEFSRPEYWSG